MYIGTIPTPAATESRQEFTATANQTTFSTTGGTVGYCDCFLNGVKLASSDFTFDGADITLTTGAAAGDTVAVIMRQADNALVALPIKDSAGNNVLSEANNVVSIGSGVKFPAGHILNVVHDSWQGKTSSLSNPSVWTATGLEADIQVSSGNYVLVECVLAVEVITSGTNGLVALASGANNTTVDNNDFIIDPWMIQGLAINDNVITAGQYLHTTPQSTVPQRYKVFVKPEAGYSVEYGAQTGAGYFYNTLTLYEIQA